MQDKDYNSRYEGRPSALVSSHRLEEFEIDSVLGEGEVGVFYLAWGHNLNKSATIKEYMSEYFEIIRKDNQTLTALIE